jgi:hypothetical protein
MENLKTPLIDSLGALLTTLFLIAPTGKIPEHYIGMPKMS